MNRYTILLLLVIITGNGYSQQFRLIHDWNPERCGWGSDIYNIYKDFPNKIIVQQYGKKKINRRDIVIQSDSVAIERINDSMYWFRPNFDSISCRIYIRHKKSGELIETYTTHVSRYHFRFYTGNNEYPIQRFLELPYLIINPGCIAMAKNFRIRSYEVQFRRRDSLLGSVSLKDKEFIPGDFKKFVQAQMKPGDRIIAKDIIIEDQNGVYLQADDEYIISYWPSHWK